MNRTHVLAPTLTLLAFGLALLPAPSPGAEAVAAPGLQVGVIGTVFRDIPEAMTQVVIRPLKELMREQTGLTSSVSTVPEAQLLGQQLAENKVQLGVFHGFEFGWARQKYPVLKPLMITVTPQKILRALVVIRADGKAAGLADLKDKVLAVPSRSRGHCHLFLERRCLDLGQPPHNYFAKVVTPPNSEQALDQVVDSAVDLAIVERDALENYEDRKPGRFKKLKVLLQSEAFPNAVVAYRPGALDDATLERFRKGMLTANQTARGKQLLTLCQIVGFEHVPENFDQELADIVKAYPPLAK